MLNEFELKREEEKHQKTLQKYEELLAMEIEWHTQRIASINFFLAKIKRKQDAEFRGHRPASTVTILICTPKLRR